MGVLAARAAVRLSVLRALEQLDAFSLALLDGLVLSDDATTLQSLAALVADAASPDRLRAGVERLRDLALVWGSDDALRVVGPVRDVVAPAAAGLGRPVATLLARLRQKDIEPVARNLGVGSAAAIIELFSDGARLAELLATAGPAERRVLEALASGSPLGQVQDARRAVEAAATDSPVRWLLAHGLLVPIDDSTVELPREVGLLVRGASALGTLHPEPPPLETSPVGVTKVDGAAA